MGSAYPGALAKLTTAGYKSLLVRSYYTTREVQTALGNVSQQRVSQLVREGLLAADRDADGRLKYDRELVDRYVSERAGRAARRDGEAEERSALQAEARERLARERRRVELEKESRRAREDELRERAVTALERIAVACLSKSSF